VPTHLVQITNGIGRRVALVDEPHLRCIRKHDSVYDIALYCIRESLSMEHYLHSVADGDSLLYEDVYARRSEWRLMSPIDVPDHPSQMLISGTGLTHIGSAQQRQAMHAVAQIKKTEDTLTDSMRMFQWGVDGGRPPEGIIGIAPEWFYKGDGSILRAPFEPLEIPGHAEDGGEEAELAGIYVVNEDGTPWRAGFAQGNEFSDHKFERRNYLNLAGSKLRTCSVGPELVIGAEFANVPGHVRITRGVDTIWAKEIASGEQNMCHSLANLEYHHFKFAAHRQPGSVHIHFLGANTLSFGDGIELGDGDVVEVAFEGFGRPLRNPICTETKRTEPIRIRSLA
jgi:hypothetical protein